MLNDEAVKEYQEIYEKEYDKKISFEEARKQGEQLVRLYRAVCKPEDNQQ